MATLKEDSSSWRAGGVIKRDSRHSHDGPETVEPAKAKKSKKDTRKWCRGKVGRQHTVVEELTNTYTTADGSVRHEYTIRCAKCGMTRWRLPEEAIAQVRLELRQQLAAAAQNCTGGHVYEVQTRPSLFGANKTARVKVCTGCAKEVRLGWQ